MRDAQAVRAALMINWPLLAITISTAESASQSRRAHRAAAQMLLRLVHGQWPSEAVPTTAYEIDVIPKISSDTV
jgi:hypothetical protein